MGGKYGRELKRTLAANGCYFVRQGKGDHEIWFSPITGLTFTVDAGTRKLYTANAILKQAGIKTKL
ncbi:MAG: type II toxin-antitoxin system HicA family toxin [Sphingomonas sp.]|uniref:type II toxin-antitoxin system HicA family toxin n=1 Tax=Sphingomonas sp. TaxID=28214 RepID=UPI0025D80689|nr:type II toxin-antitoxin system HicA family toxin [Sphingomonas sp.]MBY0283555.1 type II toxin-antitoxin system HicA family toxin [Sphingomonas sp.]